MSIKKCKGYDEAFRMKVVRDYYESGMSFYFIAKKYCLSGGDIVKKWIKEYPIDEKELSFL